MEQYGIWCRVEGGVTGTRESWLKHAGVSRVYTNKQVAEEAACHLNDVMNHEHSKAKFTYTTKVYES